MFPEKDQICYIHISSSPYPLLLLHSSAIRIIRHSPFNMDCQMSMSSDVATVPFFDPYLATVFCTDVWVKGLSHSSWRPMFPQVLNAEES